MVGKTRSRRLLGLLAGCCALTFSAPAAAGAATDMFLNLSGIPGESNDSHFANQIDVLSYSWGVSNPASKVASFQNLKVTKYVDRASPALFLRTANGQVIDSAALTVRKGGEQPFVFLQYCLTGVRVTGVSTTNAGADQVTEDVSFSYATFVERYVQQAADGSVGPVFTAGWDLVRNLQFGPAAGAC